MTSGRSTRVSIAGLMLAAALVAIALAIVSPPLEHTPIWHRVFVTLNLLLPCWCVLEFWPWGERWSERRKLIVTVLLVLGVLAVLIGPFVWFFLTFRGID